MHPLNVVAVVAEKTMTSLKKKSRCCFPKPNPTHPLNVAAVVAEKDVDSFEEKIRGLFPETESFG